MNSHLVPHLFFVLLLLLVTTIGQPSTTIMTLSEATEEPNYNFEGWLGYSLDSANGKMGWGSFEPKAWEEDDVDIQITHCGVCGSDTQVLKSGWGETPYRKYICLHTGLLFV